MTNRTELYIVARNAANVITREIGPLTSRGFGRAHKNLLDAPVEGETLTHVVVRTVHVVAEEIHPIKNADAVLRAIVARSREVEIDAEIERLVQEKRKLQGSLDFGQPEPATEDAQLATSSD